jgi:ABC-type transporter Mla MlaB component
MRRSVPGVALLRVTLTTIGGVAELRIEGCIASPAASELWKECRSQTRAGRRLRLELSGVTSVDEISVVKLKRLIHQGAEIVNASLLVSAFPSDDL